MSWREKLPELEGFALLPCGAGDKGKAPIDQVTGKHLNNWPDAFFTPDDILAMNGKVKCVGVRPGPDSDNLLFIDIDGASALTFCQEQRCDLKDAGWIIRRTTADDRLKVAFQINDQELEEELSDIGKTVHSTGAGEQLELFWSTGQCVVLGDHKTSGGKYFWEGSPADIDSPTEPWRELIKLLIQITRQRQSSGGQSEKGDWRDCIPCPICGRTEPDCRINANGDMVLCHQGTRWSPPEMKVGETVERDGVTWAMVGDGVNAIGPFSTFKIHAPITRSIPAPTQGVLSELISEITDGWTEKGRLTPANAGMLEQLLSDIPGDRIRFNLLTMEIEIDGQRLSSTEAENAYIRFQQRGYNCSKQSARDALRTSAERFSFHPVRDYLNGLEAVVPQDITRLASTFLRPADSSDAPTIYDRMVFITLIGAVARVMEPGCKFDTCTVLQGKQGIRKTSFWQALFGEYFTTFRGRLDDKDGLLVVHQSWGLELGELDNITGSYRAGQIKNFVTTQCDHFRAPYAAKSESAPRPSVFVGTCNRNDFLHDDTGERRWLIIPVELKGQQKIHTHQLSQIRDGIWKAALDAYRQGALTYLNDEDEQLIEELNRDFTADTLTEGAVQQFLAENSGRDYYDPQQVYLYVSDKLNVPLTDRLKKDIKVDMARTGLDMKRGPADKFGQKRPRKFFRTDLSNP